MSEGTSTPFCDKCGKEAAADAQFCRECGRRLQTPTPSPPPIAPPKPASVASKDRRYKATIAAAFLVALVLGVALGSAMSPQPVCAPCPKTIITETIERTQTVTSTQSTVGTEITTTATATAQRAIELSMSVHEKRVSTGDCMGFSARTSWEDVSLITSMKVTVVAPDGVVVLSDNYEGSYYMGVWCVPSDAKWGVYTVTLVASKEGYVSAQASDTFEVI